MTIASANSTCFFVRFPVLRSREVTLASTTSPRLAPCFSHTRWLKIPMTNLQMFMVSVKCLDILDIYIYISCILHLNINITLYFLKRSKYHSETQSAATTAKKLKELNVVYRRIFLFYIENYGGYREFTQNELEGCKMIEEIKIVLDCSQGYVCTSVITTTCATYNSRLIHFTNLYAYLHLKRNPQLLL